MAYTQADRLIAIKTPLGEDALLLQGFTGHEGISRPFSFHLDLLSENPAIPFDQIVGQRASLRIHLVEGERYINGFISRFSQRGSDARFTYYQAELVSWLWFLTRTVDARIFQNMTVPDIIKKIFTDLGFTDFKLVLQKSYEPREYCVQYRETDFNFVSRLMEQYGIFYFFEHEENKHTLVLGDTPSAHQPCVGQEQARCQFGVAALEEEDIVTEWLLEQELRPGKYALTDYNFEMPSTSLMVNMASKVKVSGNDKYEVYDYPGEYLKKQQGEALVKTRMEEDEAQYSIVTGASTCRAFCSGARFDLTEHYRDDMNKSYVVTELAHSASVGDSYMGGANAEAGEVCSNRFKCIPHETPFRSERVTPRPIVQGPQTAVVVGPGGEEIYTDKYGRVKVQFHWDREGKRDEKSSCWIRVSYPWAGQNWGGIHIPRIGQEVIVDFLEGDPDQPIITGRVYNAEQMPPYALPANQTQSGVKSRSSKGGGEANFNEIRFEDKKGSEEVYIHAEKDENIVVENDKSENVGHNETITIGNDREEKVIGYETLSVKKDRTRTVSQNEFVTVGLTRTHNVGINEMINVGAAQEVTVVAFRTLSVGLYQNTAIGLNHDESVGGNHSETIKHNHSVNIGDNQTIQVDDKRTVSVGKEDVLKVGTTLTIDAKDQILIKTGKASILMKKDGTILIDGKDITVKGSGEINVKASKNIVMKGKNILEN